MVFKGLKFFKDLLENYILKTIKLHQISYVFQHVKNCKVTNFLQAAKITALVC